MMRQRSLSMAMAIRLASVVPLALLASCAKPSLPPASPSVSATQPLRGGLSLEPPTGDLGIADFGSPRECVFTVHNQSRQRVSLVVGEKSCACAGVHIDQAELPAGHSTKVVLTWVPKLDLAEGLADQTFRLWAEVLASDGTNLRLEATGQLQPKLRVHLPQGRLDWGRLDLADLRAGSKELAIEALTLLPSPGNLKLAASTSHPGLEVAAITPLTSERLRELGATAGHRLVLRAGTKLPTGRFRERLNLQSSLYPEPLELKVTGQVENGAASVIPEQVDVATARLEVKQGYRCSPVRVRLRHESARQFEVVSVEPPLFAVRVTPAGENEWTLEVKLRPEAELRGQLGPVLWEEFTTFGFEGGAIRCRTNHSQVPELRIPISSGRLRP